MLPVDPGLANELEKGYTYMRPWTQTWQDELDSCVENGADAEAKIVWALYPEEQGETERQEVAWHKERERSRSTDADSNEHPENQADEATTTKSKRKTRFETNEAAGPEGKKIESNKSFATCSVIYVNSRDAQILRPNLLPSVSRGRRPLSSIRKGREIGIPVVRGFDRKEWDKLHPPKLPATSARRIVRMYQPGRRSSSTHADEEEGRCYGCTLEEHKPRPSDLLLVIHGIGQKLSERVESFHFTHHINAFRRQVNVELNEDSVWPSLRPSMEGIAVLPVNWRAILSREDEDVQALTTDDPNANQFTLKDITPETMPYVRNLISDVMLDIPYYLSHHKQKMNAALVREANRIYRLWCAHNPGFQETGRTHVVAHSLGSVMAVDILSQQPTKLPSDIDFLTSEPSETMFEFDTKSLFLCGSPAGFFLLLNKAALLPRRGRGKPGSEGDDLQKWIAAEEGTYGCLAVDNVYNILHDTDPISYCLNAAVDCDFAATLKPAVVPTQQKRKK
ncbi:hypothetical protein KEM55_006753 [Ascosphaera atra]|nr:hypothetical protein KEM55_006753 [Ascosphaera atra]